MDEDKQLQKEKTLQYYQQLDKFYGKFSDKLIVFDPLDRPILQDDKNGKIDIATKTDEFIQIIRDMQFIDGKKLGATLSDDMPMNLDQ